MHKVQLPSSGSVDREPIVERRFEVKLACVHTRRGNGHCGFDNNRLCGFPAPNGGARSRKLWLDSQILRRYGACATKMLGASDFAGFSFRLFMWRKATARFPPGNATFGVRQAGGIVTVYAFMNLKGGVGKTTLAANLGYELAEQQKAAAVLVDTDPQCNLTQVFLRSDQLDQIQADRTVFATFKTPSKYVDPHPADLRITVSPKASVRVDLIPGSFETLKFGVMQNGLRPIAMMDNFTSFITQCKAEYGTVILDTNPSSTFTTLCALSVA